MSLWALKSARATLKKVPTDFFLCSLFFTTLSGAELVEIEMKILRNSLGVRLNSVVIRAVSCQLRVLGGIR